MLRPFLYSFVFFSSVCWSHRPTRSVLGGEDRINKYDITYPKVIKQPQNEVQGPGHPDELTVELTVEGKKFTLELELNKVVFSKNFKHTVRGGSGYKEYTNMENCYYQGKVREEPEWSAVISTCKGLRGAFGVLTVINNSYYIEPMEGKVNGAHIVYRPSELSDSHFSGKCGSETGDSSELHNIPSFPVQKKDFNNSKVKRQAGTDLYLELYIVTDVAAFTTRGGDMESLLQDVTEAVNVMDNFYRKLNTVVRIALVEIETWTTTNQISVTTDARATLNLWKVYYQANINTKPSRPDAGLLFVGGTFLDNILGIAPTEAMCRPTNGGLSRLRVRNPLQTATTAAHELGHMFGLRHDDNTDPCPCSQSQCIMTAIISGLVPQEWSECSQTAFTGFVTKNNYAELCLDDEPVFINSQNNIPYKCGNGIREPGETCDCGPVATCTDSCCNATTCELAETASCSTHEACCENCGFRQAGIKCRSVANECDVPEFCTGQSGECPTNRFLRNGYNCTNGNELGYCINGQCLTHSTQCRSIYGSGSSSAPAQCYDYNTEGNCWGKCGRVGVTDTFTACREEDILCGMTWCVPSSLQPRDVPSDSRTAIIRCGNGVSARSVCYQGTNAEITDPGYVWDNIRCGTNKVCMNQRCVDANFATNTCPMGINGTECNGNGVCTNENICFCDSGFTGPACDNRAVINTQPTPGGSNAGGIAAGVIIALLIVAGVGVAITVALVYIFIIRPRRASKDVTTTANKTRAHYVNPDQHHAYSPPPPANLTKNPSYDTHPQRRPPPKPATNGYSPRVAQGHVNGASNNQPMQPPVRNRDPPPPPYNPSSKPNTSAVQPRRPPPPPMKQEPINPPVSSKPPVTSAKPTPPSKPTTAVKPTVASKPPVSNKPGKVSAVWPPPSNSGATPSANKQPLLPPNMR